MKLAEFRPGERMGSPGPSKISVNVDAVKALVEWPTNAASGPRPPEVEIVMEGRSVFVADAYADVLRAVTRMR